jgi:cytochrome P450
MAASDASEDRMKTDSPALAELFFQPVTLSAPFAMWKRMRREQPVLRARLPGTDKDVFFVTRREDIEYVAAHTELFSSRHDPAVYRWGNLGPEFDPVFRDGGVRLPSTLVNTDPPISLFFRKVVLDALSPVRVRAMRPHLQAMTENLLDTLPTSATVDFKQEVAVPLAIDAISYVLGLSQSDRDFIFEFTNAVNRVVDPLTPLPQALEAAARFVAAQKYLIPWIESLREAPSQTMLSAIANTRRQDGALLPMEEALSMAFTVIAAGNETTRNSMIFAAYTLASRPDLAARLRETPEMIPNFVEEALRVGSPSGTVPRTALCDTDLAGTPIPAGATLFLLWGSGNYDEAAIDSPETFDLGRPNVRKHLSFGHGVHYCAGVHLARAEIETAVECMLERYELISLPTGWGGPQFDPSFHVRQMRELPLVLEPRGPSERSQVRNGP